MTWRRATRLAAWVSIGFTFLFTLTLPILVPLIPGVRTDADLARKTEGYAIERTYTAKAPDVERRREEMVVWDALAARGGTEGTRPKPLVEGESFQRSDYVAPQSIFWQTGVSRDDAGNQIGGGLLKVELIAIEWLGFDLTQNRQSLNETLAALMRIVIPFGAIFLVSFFTTREDRGRLDFFYARLRTPASADHAADAVEVERVRANPSLRDDLKLFPASDWEFRKWQPADWKGQAWVCGAAAGLVVSLYLLVTIGK
jgi:hypothetical protein